MSHRPGAGLQRGSVRLHPDPKRDNPHSATARGGAAKLDLKLSDECGGMAESQRGNHGNAGSILESVLRIQWREPRKYHGDSRRALATHLACHGEEVTMRLVCIAAAHTPYQGAVMERSAQRVGVEIVRFKQGEPWPNDYRVGKLVHGLECVLSLPSDVTHVMHVDTSDSLFLAGPEEILQKYELLERSIVIQGEKNCYPDKELMQDYPEARTRWHYVNSGGWIAHRRAAEEAMASVAKLAEYCDQLCWSRAYLRWLQFSGQKHVEGWFIDVDENCQIFQSMYLQEKSDFRMENGRLENLRTGGCPCVAHWNGTRNLAPPGLLSRVGMWSTINIKSQVDRMEAVSR